MKRRKVADNDSIISNINVVPLVDIFLVLLIIFMITAKFFVEEARKIKEIPVSLPKASTGKKPEKTKKLSILIYRNGDMRVNGKKMGFKELKGEISKAMSVGMGFKALISADRRVEFQKVVTVMDFLQLNGISDFSINVEIVDLNEKH